MQEFYFGEEGVTENAAPGGIGLKPLLALKVAEIDPRTACSYPLGFLDGNVELPVSVRVGRYGPYVEQGERRASISEEMPPDEMTLAVAVEMLAKQELGEEPMGRHPVTNKPIYIKPPKRLTSLLQFSYCRYHGRWASILPTANRSSQRKAGSVHLLRTGLTLDL